MAAALPGMDSTENKPPEDSILFNLKKPYQVFNKCMTISFVEKLTAYFNLF